VSAVVEAEPDSLAPPERRPGTFVRFLLLLAALAGGAVVLRVGFPPGASERLPALLLALGFALDAVLRRSRAVRDFCYVFPLSGLVASVFGSSDSTAWPVLLFAGLAAGWTFRYLYDFESAADESRLDRPLAALLVVWTMGALLALVRARSLWAILHGFAGRAVNRDGLLDAAAVRETILTFAVLAAGAAFFFLLRRSGAEARRHCVRAALVGTAFSAGAALFQAIGIFPADTRPFWKLTGRLSGGATDPNALGLLCGIGIVVLLAHVTAIERPAWAVGALVPLPVGLALSGSRSGLIVALLGSVAVIAFASMSRRLRITVAVAALAIALAVLFLRGSPGAVGGRVGQLFESALSLEDRTSSRPVLWRAALKLFRESPIPGGGLGSFSWRLPDLLPAGAPRLPMRDNPGSAYLQALAETGIVGLFVVLVFAAALVRQAFDRRRDPAFSGAAAALPAALVAFLVGSHWLAPDVSLLFFLLAAHVALDGSAGRRISRITAAAIALSAVATVAAVAKNAGEEETFRHSPLIGFHAAERGPGGAFRWTRRRFAVRVSATLPRRLSLANYSPEGRPVGVVVRSGERVLYGRSVRPGETVHLALHSGGAARTFSFSLDRAFVPKRLTGSEDRRELGLLAVLPEDGPAPSGLTAVPADPLPVGGQARPNVLQPVPAE
jgi:O-antigen ligase